jgi:sorbitol-specific phosphotransferase system component IIC
MAATTLQKLRGTNGWIIFLFQKLGGSHKFVKVVTGVGEMLIEMLKK